MIIDSTMWQTFKVSDIFITQPNRSKLQVPTGASVDKNNLTDGDVPRITVTGFNNGVSGYYQIKKPDKNYRVYENFISVSFLGTVFYHEGLASLDMKVHCLKLKNKQLNKHIGKFLVSVINASLKDSSYADQISSTILPDLLICLPIDDNGQPDWNYMEKYMLKLETETINKLNILLTIQNDKSASSKINICKWKRFHLYDENLFDIDIGTKLDKVKMTEKNPTINFVGRANSNNGITTCVDFIEGLKPYKAGSLTVSLGGEYLGSCFVQPKDFYTSQNVIVLIPRYEMSFNVKQFIATMIFRESRTYYKAFIDELNKHIKTDFSFPLPVDNNNKPNWEYMENFMKCISNKVQQTFNKLNCL